MIVWDWGEIVVMSGGWWLVVILALSAIAAVLVGYGVGFKRGVDRPRYWETDG